MAKCNQLTTPPFKGLNIVNWILQGQLTWQVYGSLSGTFSIMQKINFSNFRPDPTREHLRSRRQWSVPIITLRGMVRYLVAGVCAHSKRVNRMDGWGGREKEACWRQAVRSPSELRTSSCQRDPLTLGTSHVTCSETLWYFRLKPAPREMGIIISVTTFCTANILRLAFSSAGGAFHIHELVKMLSVCVSVNRSGTSRNRCTQRLVILHVQTY